MPAVAQVIRVLLVEDDGAVAETVRKGLAPLGFCMAHAPSLSAANRLLTQAEFHAVVLDLTLPDGDGLEFAMNLRAAGHEIPVLMLTARDTVADRLLGFERGADDYVGKPFDVGELAARLRAIIRRAHHADRHRLQYGDLELDLVTRRARRPGLEAVLSDRETELLALFIRRPNEVLSRDVLLNELWGDDMEKSSNLVNVYINLLRNKIESPLLGPLIRTVRGIGYVLSDQEVDETR